MPIDLDAIEAHYRRVWRDTEGGRRLPLTARLVAAQESAGDVPALVARVRELEAALADIADTAVGTVRALEVATTAQAPLLVRIVEGRLRGIQRTAEAELTAVTEGAQDGR